MPTLYGGGNFRGFPYTPGTDFVTRFPKAGDQGNDGGRRG